MAATTHHLVNLHFASSKSNLCGFYFCAADVSMIRDDNVYLQW